MHQSYDESGKTRKLPPFRQFCEAAGVKPEHEQHYQLTDCDLDECSTLYSQPPSNRLFIDTQVSQDLKWYKEFIPRIEVDLQNQWEVWLWDELKDKPLSQWIELHFARSPNRVPYGLKPSSKRPKVLSSRNPQHVKESHAQKEQDRRDRHRRFQCQNDLYCSEFHFRLARERLRDAKQMYGHSPLYNKPSSSRDTGKDEQLLATLFQQIMSRWIIIGQEQRNEKLLAEISYSQLEQPTSPLPTGARRKSLTPLRKLSPTPSRRQRKCVYRSKL